MGPNLDIYFFKSVYFKHEMIHLNFINEIKLY